MMTIHVSKGLEFDHVFLPFLSDVGKPGSRQNDFVFHEQKRIWTVGLSVDDDGGSTAGPIAREWNSIVEAWSMEEKKRLLYVAMTRARESLFLSATGEPKPNSFLSFLKLSREAGAHENYRTLTTVETPSERYRPAEKSDKVRVPWGSIERKRNENSFVSISVTRLLELEDEDEVKRNMPERKAQPAKRSLSMAVAAARGTRLHRVFEMAKPDIARDGADNSKNADVLAREIARWFVEDEQEDARKALKWLLSLKEPNLASILVSGEVEWSFTYVRGEFAVDGQIDLWGRDEAGRLWVVDYKTGDSVYKEKALRQLKYYAEALAACGLAKPGEEIYLCALYPFSEEVFTEPVVLSR